MYVFFFFFWSHAHCRSTQSAQRPSIEKKRSLRLLKKGVRWAGAHQLTRNSVHVCMQVSTHFWNFQSVAEQTSKNIHMNMLCVSEDISIILGYSVFIKALCSVMHELCKQINRAHDSRINWQHMLPMAIVWLFCRSSGIAAANGPQTQTGRNN